MAKNTIADLDTTASNNTDVLNQSTQGTAAVSTIDTMIQNSLGLLARFYADLGGLGTVGGTADAITLTTASTYQTLENGITLSFKAGSAITGASTINVDGLGDKAIRRIGDSATQAGDIVANGVYLLRYDTAYNSAAGAWILLNAAGATAATTSAAGIVELATVAETLAGSSSALAVTPAGLSPLYSNVLNNAIEIADLKGSRLNMAGGIADAYDSETDVDTATSTNESYSAANDQYSPTTGAGTYSTLNDPTFTTDNNAGTAFTVRQQIATSGYAVSSNSANIRVTFTGSTTAATTLINAYVGHKGGSAPDFDGGQVRLTFSGNNGGTIAAGGTLTSDNIAFAFDYTKDLIVSFDTNSLNERFVNSVTAHTQWTKSSVGDAATTTGSGYSSGAGKASIVDLVEIETTPGTPNNMTLVSNAFTASAVPTVARVATFIDPQEAITINTDFTAEASRDGGSTWTAVTLALVSNPVGTVEQYEGSASISAQPSGSSMKYRLKTLNNKDIDVTGTVFQWS